MEARQSCKEEKKKQGALGLEESLQEPYVAKLVFQRAKKIAGLAF